MLYTSDHRLRSPLFERYPLDVPRTTKYCVDTALQKKGNQLVANPLYMYVS